MQDLMCSSWMLIVTVVCGFVTGVALFSHKCHGQGGQMLPEVAVCKLPCRPATSKQSLLFWVNFVFEFCFWVWVWANEKSHHRASPRLKSWKCADASLHVYLLSHKDAFLPFAVAVHYFWLLGPQIFWTNGQAKCWDNSFLQCLILALSSQPN